MSTISTISTMSTIINCNLYDKDNDCLYDDMFYSDECKCPGCIHFFVLHDHLKNWSVPSHLQKIKFFYHIEHKKETSWSRRSYIKSVYKNINIISELQPGLVERSMIIVHQNPKLTIITQSVCNELSRRGLSTINEWVMEMFMDLICIFTKSTDNKNTLNIKYGIYNKHMVNYLDQTAPQQKQNIYGFINIYYFEMVKILSKGNLNKNNSSVDETTYFYIKILKLSDSPVSLWFNICTNLCDTFKFDIVDICNCDNFEETQITMVSRMCFFLDICNVKIFIADVGNKYITNEWIQQFSQYIKGNKTLIECNIFSSIITRDCIDSLKDIIKYTSITSMKFNGYNQRGFLPKDIIELNNLLHDNTDKL
jgi:hypothetical protein